jgi:hypothetical protein
MVHEGAYSIRDLPHWMDGSRYGIRVLVRVHDRVQAPACSLDTGPVYGPWVGLVAPPDDTFVHGWRQISRGLLLLLR